MRKLPLDVVIEKERICVSLDNGEFEELPLNKASVWLAYALKDPGKYDMVVEDERHTMKNNGAE